MKNLFFLVLFLGLFSTTTYAAGQMDGVRQEIDISNATISTTGGSNGGSASGEVFGFGKAGFEKTPGQIDVGVIKNSGGTMKEVGQTIKAKGAKINASGAPIGIGEISNSK